MAKDRQKKYLNHPKKKRETGARKGRTGQSTVEDDTDEGVPEKEKIKIMVVDEIIESRKIEDEVSQARVKPEGEIEETSEENIWTLQSSMRASKQHQQINQTVRLKRGKDYEIGTFQVPISGPVRLEKKSHSNFQMVSPDQELTKNKEGTMATSQELTSEKNKDVVEQVINLQSPLHARRDELLELDEDDPIFKWVGGNPYESGKPKLVIHKAEKNIPSLSFLQILLRDTYKEIEGGEPGADTVELVANELRIPQIQKNIITLDLTKDYWSVDLRNGQPVIEHNNIDIVPKLREVASTLYTGELGYFVVNVPSEWEGDIVRSNFFPKLVNRITGNFEEGKRDEIKLFDDGKTIFEEAKSTPVTLAEPAVHNLQEFFQKVSNYFALFGNLFSPEKVEQVEEIQKGILRKNDWKRIALTQRQQTGDESDEHYFWKSLIAEGIALEMKKAYDLENEDHKKEKFGSFLKEKILSGDPVIKTEFEIKYGPSENNTYKPDIYVSPESSWQEKGLKGFIEQEDGPITGDIAIEFETGRSEGAFNFRKILETLEKYSSTSGSMELSEEFICIVIPPRLLFRGENRARMITSLVSNWNETEGKIGAVAGIYVPQIGSGYCNRLIPASKVIDEIYKGD